MIAIDISEKEYVKNAFKKRLGNSCVIKQLGSFDCELKKIPLQKNNNVFCASEEETFELLDMGLEYINKEEKCKDCLHSCYVRFADFEIMNKRGYWERKNSADFIASRRDRLYDQLNKIDTFVSGRKGLILEGMPRHIRLQDSKNFFSGYDKKHHDLRGLSPLEQAHEIGGNREWNLSFIRECKMRDIEVFQSWDLNETIEFLIQCDEGYDQTPKLRVIPKRYPDIPLEQNILALFNGIGKQTSAKLLEEFGTLSNLITTLRKMKKSEAEKHKKLYELWKVFK